MYCKNCGKEIESENAICTGCGFRGNHGDKFCSHCGKEVLKGQAMCVNCGFMLEENSSSTTDLMENKEEIKQESTEKPYVKYKPTVRKINIFTIIMHACAICLVLCMLFLPIYKCRYEPNIEDIENLEQLEDALEDGYLEKNFSLAEDVVITIKALMPENSENAYGFFGVTSLLIGMFAMFEMVFGVIIIVTSVIAIFKTANGMMDEDQSAMLTYDAMLKTGQKDKKEGVFKKQMVLSFVLYAVFDIIFTLIDGKMFANISTESTVPVRNMVNFSGVSGFISIMAITLVGYFVVSFLKRKETNNMLSSITANQYK